MSHNPHAPAPQPFGVELTQTHDSAWVHLFGELDVATAADAEADFIDSTGISLLVRCNRSAEVEDPETEASP